MAFAKTWRNLQEFTIYIIQYYNIYNIYIYIYIYIYDFFLSCFLFSHPFSYMFPVWVLWAFHHFWFSAAFLFFLHAYHFSYRSFLSSWGTCFKQQWFIDVDQREITAVSNTLLRISPVLWADNCLLEKFCIRLLRIFFGFWMPFWLHLCLCCFN